MKNVTIVYTSNNDGKMKSEHITDATSEKIQAFFDSKVVHALDYVLVHNRTIGVNEFDLYTSQQDLLSFQEEWALNF